MNEINWPVLAPALTLLTTASAALLVALFVKSSKPVAVLSLVGLAVAAAFNLPLFVQSRAGATLSSFGLSYLADLPSTAFTFIILLGTALAIALSWDYLQRSGLEQPEYYPLLLLSATGAVVVAAAGDLITLILGLEIMSLAVYVLSTWRTHAKESEEAGMKYFLLGAFASAFFIYGIALTFGATGSFVFSEIAAALAADGFDQLWLASLGGLMLLVGLGFKIALAPFHQWAPDVYTGAPTPVTAFMSVVVKTAVVAALIRVFATIFPELAPLLTQAFAVLIAVTLIVANFGALMQRGVKRLLAYSAVAHAGYLGLAVLAASDAGMRAAIWYLLAYTLMNMGAFAVLTLLTDKNDHGDAIERFNGLGRTRPWLAVALTIFLLSLAGIPPLAGFVAKIFVFTAAITAGYVALAVLAIVTSVVAAFYYFGVVRAMYFREAEYDPPQPFSRATQAVVAVAAIGTVLLGLLPGWWYELITIGQGLLSVAGL